MVTEAATQVSPPVDGFDRTVRQRVKKNGSKDNFAPLLQLETSGNRLVFDFSA